MDASIGRETPCGHRWGGLFEIAGIEPTPFIRKMMAMAQNDGRYDEEDYRRYEMAMEAICSRKPERMTGGCVEMLRAKVGQIGESELRASAEMALEELIACMDETHPTTPAAEAI